MSELRIETLQDIDRTREDGTAESRTLVETSEQETIPDWSQRTANKAKAAHGRVASAPMGAVLSLPPEKIRHSVFANREAFNWTSPAFESLKEQILASGGNSVPISVRRVDGDLSHDYEINYGHRRHRACLELGIEVRAQVEQLDDVQMVLRMILENQGRTDLSPIERGRQYERAMRVGRFKSQRDIAAALGIKDHSGIGKDLKLASLPNEVVDAFPSPADIQVNWAPALHAALDENRNAVLKRAAGFSAGSRSADAKFVFEQLCGVKSGQGAGVASTQLVCDHHGKKIATLTLPRPGSRKGIVIQLEPWFDDVESLKVALRACLTPGDSALIPHSDGASSRRGNAEP